MIYESIPRPFVKWAGGKRQIVHTLLDMSPRQYNRYFEPFLGGGAMFFALKPQQAVLADMNDELINTYIVVRDQVDALITDLARHRNEKEYFYQVRAQDPAELSPVQRASRFIFLNKTCFNGLWRVNSSGRFNVPFGRYKNPRIVDEKNLRACSKLLKRARLLRSDFENTTDLAKPGDFVYFDPPYVPLSDTAYFTAYTKKGFGPDEQRRLAGVFTKLAAKGVHVMLSNSDTPFVRDLYAGFHSHTLEVARFINSNAARRRGFTEVIITNYRP